MEDQLPQRNLFIHNREHRRFHRRVDHVPDIGEAVIISAGHHQFPSAGADHLKGMLHQVQVSLPADDVCPPLVRVHLVSQVPQGQRVQLQPVSRFRQLRGIPGQEPRGQEHIAPFGKAQGCHTPQGHGVDHTQFRRVALGVIPAGFLAAQKAFRDLCHQLDCRVQIHLSAGVFSRRTQGLQSLFPAQLVQHGYMADRIVVVTAVHPPLQVHPQVADLFLPQAVQDFLRLAEGGHRHHPQVLDTHPVRGFPHTAENVAVKGDIALRFRFQLQGAVCQKGFPYRLCQAVVSGILPVQDPVGYGAVHRIGILLRDNRFLPGHHQGIRPSQAEGKVSVVITVVPARHVRRYGGQRRSASAGNQQAVILPANAEKGQPGRLRILRGGKIAVDQVQVIDALVVLGSGIPAVIEADQGAASVRHHNAALLCRTGSAEEGQQLNGPHLSAARLHDLPVRDRDRQPVRSQRIIQGDHEGCAFRGFRFLRFSQRLHFRVILHGEAGLPRVRVNLLSVAGRYALGLQHIQAAFLIQDIGLGRLFLSGGRQDLKPFRRHLAGNQHQLLIGQGIDRPEAVLQLEILHLAVLHALGIGAPGRSFPGIGIQVVQDKLTLQVPLVQPGAGHRILRRVLRVGIDNAPAFPVPQGDLRGLLIQVQGQVVVLRYQREAGYAVFRILLRFQGRGFRFLRGLLHIEPVFVIPPVMNQVPAQEQPRADNDQRRENPQRTPDRSREAQPVLFIHSAFPPYTRKTSSI